LPPGRGGQFLGEVFELARTHLCEYSRTERVIRDERLQVFILPSRETARRSQVFLHVLVIGGVFGVHQVQVASGLKE